MIDKNIVAKFYSKYSTQFDEKIGSLKNYDESYDDFVSGAKQKTNLLDLACGPGNVSAFIKKMQPDIEICCVDLSEDMLEIAKNKIEDGEFYKADILDITIPKRKYDLIVCAFGLPYIESDKISTFVKEVNRFSKKGTAIYISCMAGNLIEEEPMSFAENSTILVQRHKKEDIIKCFQLFEFELANYKTIDYSEPDGSIPTDMVFNFIKE